VASFVHFDQDMRYADREDAGRHLAQELAQYANDPDVVVLALPRGGVPVGYEVAKRLGAPLDVLVVRKLGVPGHSELAMGAIASGGIRVIDPGVVAALEISHETLDAITDIERVELERREREFRADRQPIAVDNKTVILVDDGVATGSTMSAGIDALRLRLPARIIAAVPVAPPEVCARLARRADEMICLLTPRDLYAVGLWYDNFSQTTDAEVRELLAASARERREHEPFPSEPALPA
jgi:putative phosphoribosyl transferase